MLIIICIIILVGFGALVFCSRKEQGEMPEKMSLYLYKFCCVHKLPIIETERVALDLERLNPGMSKRELQLDYYVEKIKLFLMVLLVGTLLTLLLCVKSVAVDNKGMDGVERGTAGEGEREVTLTAQVGENEEQLRIVVEEQLLRPEEVENLLQDCVEDLKLLILAENESMEQVETDLYLPDVIEGYPFEIMWSSSDASLIDSTGKLDLTRGREGDRVCLTAAIYYGEERYVEEFWVKLGTMQYERTLQERLRVEIEQKNWESRFDETMGLPQEIDGEQIIWREVQENKGILFLGLTLLAAVGVFLLKDKDLHEQVLQRKRSLKLAYPGILNKFVLYMGAGMTVRGSFFKIATDYRKGTSDKKEEPAYEEMLYSCNELSAGVSEALVYERFGKRSGLQEYARFSTLLSQNLKKGNAALLNRLREEADKAMQENLQYRKKIGEEAETKLLVPMIMMLGIVMLLVMMPAFASFE